uniref:exodeoxyribonuclease III n=1 Tax=Astyanax mexicanus TaxID=7994 RepID=A0A3B1K8B0_ASTMX
MKILPVEIITFFVFAEFPSTTMSSETRQQLCFVSWNTCGIQKTKKKRNKILDLLEELNNVRAEIVFIQETHVGPKSHKNVPFTFKGWEVFFTVYSPRSKGVAILIRNDVEFEYICHDEDHSGSYIVLFCRLYGELYTLVNVYHHQEERTLLGRLKEYLQETAEGVLVVGGDFNAVLDPNFDRLSSASHAGQSALRHILEDFTSSLNLRDIWAELHPRDIDFTRREGGSNSRLDMFFMPEDTRERVQSCKIYKTSQQKKISDHDPVVLTLLRTQQQTDNKIPNVASMLLEFGYDGKPHRKPENISGAEILSAIKSFTESGIIRPDELTVDDYKLFRCPMTEILKINYNLMLKSKFVPSLFKQTIRTQNQRTFNVDYLIFSLILARRLKVFITPSFKRQKKPNLDLSLWVNFAGYPKKIKIKWSFLERCLTSLKNIYPPPPRDFRILESLLPEDSSGEFRYLRQGCYLTNPILTLVLMQLKKLIVRKYDMASVCHFRKALFIQTEGNRFSKILALVTQFRRDCGIKLQITLKNGIYA